MSVWDGFPPPERDEDEGPSYDPLDGEVPGQPPRQPEDEEWKPRDWHDGPEYKLWRKRLEEEG